MTRSRARQVARVCLTRPAQPEACALQAAVRLHARGEGLRKQDANRLLLLAICPAARACGFLQEVEGSPFRLHRKLVRDVSWHPFEPTLATVSWDGTVVR
jgi:hypothetical protein